MTLTECKTQEEYKKRISELRKERDNLRRRADLIDKEMDNLEIDSKVLNFKIGKYVLFDRTSKHGYKTYFHVHTWANERRGIVIFGKGFTVGNRNSIGITDTERLYWENMELPTEITEEEFYKAFDDEIDKVRISLKDFTNHINYISRESLKNCWIPSELIDPEKYDLEEIKETLK